MGRFGRRVTNAPGGSSQLTGYQSETYGDGGQAAWEEAGRSIDMAAQAYAQRLAREREIERRQKETEAEMAAKMAADEADAQAAESAAKTSADLKAKADARIAEQRKATAEGRAWTPPEGEGTMAPQGPEALADVRVSPKERTELAKQASGALQDQVKADEKLREQAEKEEEKARAATEKIGNKATRETERYAQAIENRDARVARLEDRMEAQRQRQLTREELSEISQLRRSIEMDDKVEKARAIFEDDARLYSKAQTNVAQAFKENPGQFGAGRVLDRTEKDALVRDEMQRLRLSSGWYVETPGSGLVFDPMNSPARQDLEVRNPVRPESYTKPISPEEVERAKQIRYTMPLEMRDWGRRTWAAGGVDEAMAIRMAEEGSKQAGRTAATAPAPAASGRTAPVSTKTQSMGIGSGSALPAPAKASGPVMGPSGGIGSSDRTLPPSRPSVQNRVGAVSQRASGGQGLPAAPAGASLRAPGPGAAQPGAAPSSALPSRAVAAEPSSARAAAPAPGSFQLPVITNPLEAPKPPAAPFRVDLAGRGVADEPKAPELNALGRAQAKLGEFPQRVLDSIEESVTGKPMAQLAAEASNPEALKQDSAREKEMALVQAGVPLDQARQMIAAEEAKIVERAEKEKAGHEAQLRKAIAEAEKIKDPLARVARVETITQQQQSAFYGPNTAQSFAAGRRRARQVMKETGDANAAMEAGRQATVAHLEMFKQRAISGQLDAKAGENEAVFTQHIKNWSNPKDFARMAITTGIPMAVAYATGAGGLGLGARLAIQMYAGGLTTLAMSAYDKDGAIDWNDVLEAGAEGLSGAAEVPAMDALKGAGSGIKNRVGRAVARGVTGAVAEGFEEGPVQENLNKLITEGRLQTAPELISSTATGAMMGTGMGAVTGGNAGPTGGPSIDLRSAPTPTPSDFAPAAEAVAAPTPTAPSEPGMGNLAPEGGFVVSPEEQAAMTGQPATEAEAVAEDVLAAPKYDPESVHPPEFQAAEIGDTVPAPDGFDALLPGQGWTKSEGDTYRTDVKTVYGPRTLEVRLGTEGLTMTAADLGATRGIDSVPEGMQGVGMFTPGEVRQELHLKKRDLIQIMRGQGTLTKAHELVHFFRSNDMISKKDWATLVSKYTASAIKGYDGNWNDLTQKQRDNIIEESVADGFGTYARNRLAARKIPAAPKVFARVYEYLYGVGSRMVGGKSAVFDALLSGKYATESESSQGPAAVGPRTQEGSQDASFSSSSVPSKPTVESITAQAKSKLGPEATSSTRAMAEPSGIDEAAGRVNESLEVGKAGPSSEATATPARATVADVKSRAQAKVSSQGGPGSPARPGKAKPTAADVVARAKAKTGRTADEQGAASEPRPTGGRDVAGPDGVAAASQAPDLARGEDALPAAKPSRASVAKVKPGTKFTEFMQEEVVNTQTQKAAEFDTPERRSKVVRLMQLVAPDQVKLGLKPRLDEQGRKVLTWTRVERDGQGMAHVVQYGWDHEAKEPTVYGVLTPAEAGPQKGTVAMVSGGRITGGDHRAMLALQRKLGINHSGVRTSMAESVARKSGIPTGPNPNYTPITEGAMLRAGDKVAKSELPDSPLRGAEDDAAYAIDEFFSEKVEVDRQKADDMAKVFADTRSLIPSPEGEVAVPSPDSFSSFLESYDIQPDPDSKSGYSDTDGNPVSVEEVSSLRQLHVAAKAEEKGPDDDGPKGSKAALAKKESKGKSDLRGAIERLSKPMSKRLRDIKSQGGRKVGAFIADKLEARRLDHEQSSAKDISAYRKAVADLKKDGGSWDVVRDILDGKRKDGSEVEVEAAKSIRTILDIVRFDAENAGVFVGEGVDDYFPHMRTKDNAWSRDEMVQRHLDHLLKEDPQRLIKLREENAAWLGLVEGGSADPDVANLELAAIDLSRNFNRDTFWKSNPHLEQSRGEVPGKYRTDEDVIPQYLVEAYRRIVDARYLGPKSEVATQAIKSISDKVDRRYVNDAIREVLGLNRSTGLGAKVMREVGTLNGLVKLGMAAVPQLSQLSVASSEAIGASGLKGLVDVARGAWAVTRGWDVASTDAHRSGSTWASDKGEAMRGFAGTGQGAYTEKVFKGIFRALTLNQGKSVEAGGKGKLGDRIVESTYGVRTVDKFTRVMADRFGRETYIRAIKNGDKALVADLLGISEQEAADVLKVDGPRAKSIEATFRAGSTDPLFNSPFHGDPLAQVTQKHLDRAGKNFADKTLYRTAALDQPLAFRHPVMKAANTFYTFQYAHWRWNAEHVQAGVKAAKAGDTKAAMRHAKALVAQHLILGPAAGAAMLAVRSLLTGRGLAEKDEKDIRDFRDVWDAATNLDRVGTSEYWTAQQKLAQYLQAWSYGGGIGYPMAMAERFNRATEGYDRGRGFSSLLGGTTGEMAYDTFDLATSAYKYADEPTAANRKAATRAMYRMLFTHMIPNTLGLSHAVKRSITATEKRPNRSLGWLGFFDPDAKWTLAHGFTSQAAEDAREEAREREQMRRDRVEEAVLEEATEVAE